MRTGLLVCMLATTSCSVFAKDNPAYCDADAQCAAMACDPLLHRCVDAAMDLALTAVEPAVGPGRGNIPITIRGRNFSPGLTVKINNLDAGMATVNAAGDAVTVLLPASDKTCGPVKVQVTNPDGRIAQSSSLFRYKLSNLTLASKLTLGVTKFSKDVAAVPSGVGTSDFVLINNSTLPFEAITYNGTANTTSVSSGGQLNSYSQIFATQLTKNDSLRGVVTMGTDGISAWQNQSRSFSEVASFKTAQTVAFLGIGDFNGDGATDFIINDSTKNLVALRGKGGPGFGFDVGSAEYLVTTPALPGALAAADFDGDGFADFAVALPTSATILLYFGNSSLPFAGPVALSLASNPSLLTVADVNGDARPDLLVTMNNSLGAILNQGGRSFASAVTSQLEFPPNMLQIADLDCDELPDIIYAQTGISAQGLQIRTNEGAPPFYSGLPIHAPVSGRFIQAIPAHVDQDSFLDLALLYEDMFTSEYALHLYSSTSP